MTADDRLYNRIDALEKINRRYREALEWYADYNNWQGEIKEGSMIPPAFYRDQGNRARDVLKPVAIRVDGIPDPIIILHGQTPEDVTRLLMDAWDHMKERL